MKKGILIIQCIVLAFILIGCSDIKDKRIITDFRIDIATEAGKEYMKSLSTSSKGEIKAYFLEKVSESANNVVLKYHVVRNKKNNMNIDLDEINLKVTKDEDEYKVSEASAKNYMQVYVDGESIRIRNEDTAISDLLIRNKDFPVEVYLQNKKIALQKETINIEKFEALAIDSKGNNVGIIAKTNGKYLVTLAQVEDSSQAIGTDDEQGGDTSNDNSGSSLIDESLEEIMEKPIAQKLIAYDLISVSKIEDILFSDDGGYLIVQTTNGKSSTIEIYKNPDGEKLEMNLKEIFPPEDYSVTVKLINEQGNFIDVRAIGKNKEGEGTYKFEFKSKKIIKEK